MSEPVLYDWAVEVPEWGAQRHRSGGGTSLVDRAGLSGLPDLCRTAPGPGGTRTRLTRRGRVALLSVVGATLAALVAVAVALALSAGTAGASDSRPGAARSGSTVVVRDGDTLWGIAERVRPSDDPRRTVHEIVEVNDLSRSQLRPGQELLLPAP